MTVHDWARLEPTSNRALSIHIFPQRSFPEGEGGMARCGLEDCGLVVDSQEYESYLSPIRGLGYKNGENSFAQNSKHVAGRLDIRTFFPSNGLDLLPCSLTWFVSIYWVKFHLFNCRILLVVSYAGHVHPFTYNRHSHTNSHCPTRPHNIFLSPLPCPYPMIRASSPFLPIREDKSK